MQYLFLYETLLYELTACAAISSDRPTAESTNELDEYYNVSQVSQNTELHEPYTVSLPTAIECFVKVILIITHGTHNTVCIIIYYIILFIAYILYNI